jgi:hypothetical protein
MLVLTDEEEVVVKRVVGNAAAREGEDIIGLLMKDGALRELTEDQLVALAKRLAA